mgnify:CR=1 FL=1
MSKHFGWALPALALAACAPGTTTAKAPEGAPAPAADQIAPAASPTRNAYFGDVHVHTSNSFDAYIFGVRATPDSAGRLRVTLDNGQVWVQIDDKSTRARNQTQAHIYSAALGSYKMKLDGGLAFRVRREQ